MALRNILEDGDERLLKKSKKVEQITERLEELIDDMIETLVQADGVGLAAPQVGVLRRIIIVDIGGGPLVLINPELSAPEGETYASEGCLSVPGVWGKVKRPQRLMLKAMGRDGKPIQMEATDLFARVLCHETDHLDGILFTTKVEEFEEE